MERQAEMVAADGGAREESQVDELRSWILDRHPELEDVGPDTDLLDGVLADSLELITFLVLVEDVRGRPIAPHEIDKESFRTLGTIRRRYFASPAPGA